MMGQKDVVGIQRRDEAASRRVYSGIAGRAAAAIVLPQIPDARIADRLHHRARVVAGAIIDHDDLEILAALG